MLSTKSIARSTMTRFVGDPGSPNQPGATPAPGGQAAASGSGGVSAPAGGGASPSGGGTPSIAGAMHQAAAAAGLNGSAPAGTLGGSGVQPTVGAPGQPGSAAAGGVGAGQPGMSGAAAATPASLEAVLSQHPHLQAEFAAMRQTMQEAMQWREWGQREMYQRQQAARNPQTQGGQPASGQQQRAANPFGIPHFDKSVLRTFQTDPQTGELKPGPFTPPGAAFEMQQWQEARREALEGFLDDPMKYLAPLFQKIVDERAPQAAQQQIGNVQNTAFANNYVAENGAWLFVQNNGQPQRDAFGRPVLSEYGKQFAQICDQLDKSGVKDIRMQQSLAEQIVFGQAAIARVQSGQQAQVQHQQANGNLLTSAQQIAAGQMQNGQAQPNLVLNQQPIVPNNGPGNPQPVPYGGQRQVRNRMLQLAQQSGLNLEAAAV